MQIRTKFAVKKAAKKMAKVTGYTMDEAKEKISNIAENAINAGVDECVIRGMIDNNYLTTLADYTKMVKKGTVLE